MKNLFKTIFVFLTFIICFHKGPPKVLVFEIEVKLRKVRNTLLDQINPQFDSIVSKRLCFQPILIENREKGSK